MKTALAMATAALVLAGCAATPSLVGEDRAELVTGSHIPKKYRPGDDNVQVYKPTPADMANIRPGIGPQMEPTSPR
jgi:hypothetical protein